MSRRLQAGRPIQALMALALVATVVVGVGGPADQAVAGAAAVSAPAAAPPPVNVWGFDSLSVLGTGAAGYGGDGGPATAAALQDPSDVVVTPDGGTWYLADAANHRIRAVDTASGVITTIAGSAGVCGRADDPSDGCGDGGPATAATLDRPAGWR